MRVPAAALAIPLTIGCAVGLLGGDRASASFALCAAAAAALSLSSAVALIADGDTPTATIALVLTAWLQGVSLGQAAALDAYRPPLLLAFDSLRPAERATVLLTGRLRDDASPTATGVAMAIDVDRIGGHATRGGVRLSVAGNLAAQRLGEWRAGRRVQVTAALRRPTTYHNPGVPDETRALARRGIALVGSIKSAALVDVIEPAGIVGERASQARAWTRAALAAHVGVWSGRSAGVAAAIAIGDRTGLAAEDERRLQEAGTYHVIAISGGNIAVLTLLLLGTLRRLRVPRRAAAAFAIIALLFYGRITGAAPSVDRAIAAAVIYLAGRLLEQRGPSLNVLAATAAIGLAASPAAVLDPGFILSFGATLGILVCGPRLTAVMIGKRPRRGAERGVRALIGAVVRAGSMLLAGTIAAEVILIAITAALFGRITFAGLVLNFLAIPLMTVVQAGALVTLVLSAMSPAAASAAGSVVHFAAVGLIESARLVELAPWLSREVAAPADGLVAGYFVALALALWGTRLAAAGGFVAGVMAVLIVIGPSATARDAVPVPPPGTLRVAFLDVGQGDATLVRLPDGRALLVDAGGLPPVALQDPDDGPGFDIGDRVVARALRAFGVGALHTLVITHGDPDHIGGAPSVMRRFTPRAVWEGVPVPPHEPLAALARAADRGGAEWRTVQAGDRVRIAEVGLEVLHPPPPDWERQRVRNEDSVVLGVRHGAVLVILPGDVGAEGERALAARHTRAPITILKAAHHGSATSSTAAFLAAVRPAAVVFSAGKDNRFNHPAPGVVARIRATGAAMFNTATDGAVILDTDGKTVEITGWWSGRRVELK